MRYYLTPIIATLFSLACSAQDPLTSDCLGAIPVCQQIYTQDVISTGFGLEREINWDINCIPVEEASAWYIFTVDKSGQFGFLLTPNDPTDDYDWALFNLTNANCEDIFNDPTLLVSCNSAGNDTCNGPTGATGATQYSIQGANCNNDPPDIINGLSPFNELVDVVAGNTYVLLVNNFGGSTDGYMIDFGLSSDIGIFDEEPPVLASAEFSSDCSGEELVVDFNEYIQCATIDALNFEITGPGGPYAITLSSVNCDAGGKFGKQFLLNVSPPISSDQNFQLNLVVDGNTEALDICDNPAQLSTIDFTGPAQSVSLDLGEDRQICEGNMVLLDASAVSGTYLWSDGSTGPTLEVTAAGTYSVEVTTSCGTINDEVVISTGATPTLDLGADVSSCPGETLLLDATVAGAISYSWQDGSTGATLLVDEGGMYSVVVMTDCGEVSDEINVLYADAITTTLQDGAICPGESLILDATTPGASYQWQDGSTDAQFIVNMPGTYSVEVSTACETVNLSAQVTENAGALPQIDLGEDTVLCTGGTLLLDPGVPPGATVTWQDGSSASTFNVDQPGTYSITVRNACGEVMDEISVGSAEPVSATLTDEEICEGASVAWDVTTAGASYLWQDGSTNPQFTATAPGTYSVVVTTECEAKELSAEVTEIAGTPPEVDLGEDAVLCAGENIILEVEVPDGANIEWQDGSASPLFEISEPGTYSLTISNDCGSSTDEILVRQSGPIALNLPSDTILCQGERLVLNAESENIEYYVWQDNSTDPRYEVQKPGLYTVLAGNECEEVSASVLISACEVCRVYVPNAFSPDGDGVNDSFAPFADCLIENFSIKVFDRWGNLIFEGADADRGWNGLANKGELVSGGVYIWMMDFTMSENEAAKQYSLSGDVLLVK